MDWPWIYFGPKRRYFLAWKGTNMSMTAPAIWLKKSRCSVLRNNVASLICKNVKLNFFLAVCCGKPEWKICDRFFFVHLPPILLSGNLPHRQLFIAVLIVVIQSILDYHHLDRPSKIVLWYHRAFWVACRPRCINQHASLVHGLLPSVRFISTSISRDWDLFPAGNWR